jgi:cytochrome c oxidase subunit 3
MSSATVSHDAPIPFMGVSAVKLGMWLFLASEIMFFTGLLGSFVVLKFAQPDVFHAEAAHLNWQLAAFNTVVLITSSLTMALAVAATERKDHRTAARNLLITIGLALTFLVIKGFEYHAKIEHGILPSSSLFFGAYFTLTGCHGLHIIAGLIVLFRMWRAATRNQLNYESVELVGLYWHFVDLVWIFLFPLLYLL